MMAKAKKKTKARKLVRDERVAPTERQQAFGGERPAISSSNSVVLSMTTPPHTEQGKRCCDTSISC